MNPLTSLGNTRTKNSGHSSFFTCVSSPESLESVSISITSGGTKTRGRSYGATDEESRVV